MRTIINLAAILVIAALSACSTNGVREEYGKDGVVTAREYRGGDPNYAQYVAAVSQQQAKTPAFDASACAGDARCVEHVAALAALSSAGRSSAPVIQPPQPKVSGWVQAGRFVTAIAGITVPAAVNWHQSDNSTESTRALYSMVGSMHAGTVALGSQPTTITTIGGDQIGRDRIETNTSVGGNLGDTQTIGGNLGDTQTIGRDQIGRDRIDNDGVIGDDNDTRFGSDGPFDDHSNDGDECTGTDCQGVELPEPADPGT